MTEKHTRTNRRRRLAARAAAIVCRTVAGLTVAGLTAAAISTAPRALAQGQQPAYPVPAGGFGSAPGQQLTLPPLPVPPAITPNGKVVEDVIARVNDQIITRSEYERAEQQLLDEAKQQGATEAELEDRRKNLLRDMIDQQLLLSKGKELGITGDAETMRRLDDIRKQNHLDSMEALEKAATQQGVSFEDFKQQIKNQAITQQVVRDEVGRRLNMNQAQEQAYYAAHAKEFEVPEEVHLSEILVPTPDNATDAQIAAAQAKADALAAQLKAGAKFADLAKSSSGGPTASAGGDLGDFPRGKLGDVLENATFSLPAGGVTPPIRTRQGFVILRVDNHQAAGVPPLSAVEPQVQQAIYLDQLQPALRVYLTKEREDAYIDIKPGFVDAGSSRKETKPVFTSYAAPVVKKKIQSKQRAEQERAAKAQAALAAAREKVAEKQAAKAEADAHKAGVKNVSAPVKQRRIPREKIRYGQAPRTSLPKAATDATAATTPANPAISGQAPGVAMAPTESVTSISTGTGYQTGTDEAALTPAEGPTRKTRYSSREVQAEEARAKAKLVKAEVKATDRPTPTTATQSATEKEQSSALGLNGDTAKKKKKPKREKGAPVERLQEKPKTVETQAPIAPTVNPALATGPVAPSASNQSKPSADNSALPSQTGAPGATPAGQPIPATTSADPNQPATTPAPH
jgi:peptidyl-prolyl cis-trans isomerase SurA